MNAAKDRALHVVGTTPVRPDGLDKVTGRAKFAGDVHLPRMLHGKVLRSPHAHARIRSIESSRAMALPGVHAIVTAADFPEPLAPVDALSEGGIVDMNDLADNCIARTKVLYDGHAIAAVAADSPHIAERAVELIRVEYELLEPVMDLRSALSAEAPAIHDEFTPGFFFAQTERAGPNAGRVVYSGGDVDEGFRAASIVIEREFSTRPVHQGYIEPQITTVFWDANDCITVWTSTQGHFGIRDQLAGLLNLPMSRINVIPLEIGGAFGGKDTVYLDPLAAMLSKKSGRPVKMAMDRNEVLRATGPSSGTSMKVRLGADSNGRLLSADLSFAYEAGAFPGSPVSAGILTATSRYNIPNYRLEGFDVMVNKPRVKPYRAPGATQSHFAAETVMDELAEALGLDPVEFRIRNAMQTGDRMVTGQPCSSIGGLELLEAVRNHPHYRTPLEGRNRGRGFAYSFWLGSGGVSSAKLSVNADGTVQVCTGSCDLSGTRMTLAMQTAEALGLDAADVTVTTGDTQSIGYTLPSWGSRVTFATGIACISAAEKAIGQMSGRAAGIWGVDAADVMFESGMFRHRNDNSLSLSFAQLAARLDATGGAVSTQVTVSPEGAGYQLAAYLVDVEVDTATGKVTILRSTLFQDAGRAVHPDYVSGQMQGGVAQGVGWALNEEYFYAEDGTLQNTSFLDYRMPTALDLPMTETVILETPNPGHPYGVRGVGEVSIVSPPAAIANAIYDAVGVRMVSLPMSPGAVLEKLIEAGKAEV